MAIAVTWRDQEQGGRNGTGKEDVATRWVNAAADVEGEEVLRERTARAKPEEGDFVRSVRCDHSADLQRKML